jgi:hypothetical protein
MESGMPKQTPNEATSHLPEFILLALARNPSADPAYRKAAVEHLIDKGYTNQSSHPDLVLLVEQVMREKNAKNEVQSIVEAAAEAPLEQKGLPSAKDLDSVAEEQEAVLKTSVTTQTMYQDEVVPEPKQTIKPFWRK